MKPALTDAGNIKIGKTGKPLYTGDDGKEFEFDVVGASSRITDLNAESAGYRKDLKKSQGELATMTTSNTDLQATVDSIGDDSKVEMEKFKADTADAWQKKFDTLETENTTLKGQIFESDVVSKIRNSKLIDTTVLPASVFVNTFKGQFQDDHSANGWDGRPILSKENPSNNASADEALAVLLDTHPDRDSLLRSSGAHSGENHRNDGKQGVVKTSVEKIKSGLTIAR